MAAGLVIADIGPDVLVGLLLPFVAGAVLSGGLAASATSDIALASVVAIVGSILPLMAQPNFPQDAADLSAST